MSRRLNRSLLKGTLRTYAHYWPCVSLAFGFCLFGAKSPLTFFLWATLTLATALLSNPLNDLAIPRSGVYWVSLGALVLSQALAANGSVCLPHTARWLFFWMLWPLLRASVRGWLDERPLLWTLVVIAIATVVLCTFQLFSDHSLVGLLPNNPNFNAAWMASAAIAFFAWQSRRRDERILLPALVLFLSGFVFIGTSRGGLLALLIGVGYLLVRAGKSRWLVGGAVAVVAVALLFPEWTAWRLKLNSSQGFGDYRLQFWQIALRGIWQRPWFGFGPGNFEVVYQRFAFPVELAAVRFGRTTAFAHNEFLQAAVEGGIFVGGALLYAFWILVRHSARTELASTAKAITLALAAAALFNPIWHVPAIAFLTLLWAAVFFADDPVETLPSQRSRSWLQMGWISLAISLWGLLGWQALRDHWANQGRWERIVRFSPNDAEGWKQMAAKQANVEGALPLLRKAVSLNPEDVYVRETYATALEQAGGEENVALAEQEYLAARQLAPGRAVDALALGRIAYLRHDWTQALEWFRAAWDIEPYYWEAMLWVARTMKEMGKRDEAETLLKEISNRRDLILKNDPAAFQIANSPYEQRILGYDENVIRQELRRFPRSK
jgi:O-antigen ligase